MTTERNIATGMVREYDDDGNLIGEENFADPNPDAAAVVQQQEKVALNRRLLNEKVATALATNDRYLATVAPTRAQDTAQVKALTQQVSALIRLATGALDTTDTTDRAPTT